MPSRDYPDKRAVRGLAKDADLTMLSARIESTLVDYIRTTAFETRKSKQEIVAAAIALYKKSREADLAAE
ncbi:MAG: hypothetical protein LKI85_07930 [Enterobacter sp.]|nr:hypothetical protein [Enterobacter sp.]